MKKVLVIGSEGMAGHVVSKTLFHEEGIELFTTSRNSIVGSKNHYVIEAFCTSGMEKVLSEVQPDYVINCIGILVKDSQENPDKAIFINAYFPQYLNAISKKYGFKLIHISTDCVFSGAKGKYTEHDVPDETNVYGRSKMMGEVVDNDSLTIRTSIIGPELKLKGVGLLHWFLSQEDNIKGYSRAIWTGVTTIELAKFICFIVKKDVNLIGLYHLCNDMAISKLDLLLLFQDYFNNADVKIILDESVVYDKSFVNTLHQVNYLVPSYSDMIQEMHKWIIENEHMYAQYFPIVN